MKVKVNQRVCRLPSPVQGPGPCHVHKPQITGTTNLCIYIHVIYCIYLSIILHMCVSTATDSSVKALQCGAGLVKLETAVGQEGLSCVVFV